MTATFVDRSQSFKSSHRKEKGFLGAVLCITSKGEISAEARFYKPGKVAVYCALWVWVARSHHSGTGVATGYGYEHLSAAFEYAAQAAGIDLDTPVEGRGMGAVKEAMEAIGRITTANYLATVEVHP